MSRYIDEDHFISNLYSHADNDGYICFPVDELEKMIKAEPTADVRENVHGEWIDFEYSDYSMCSICGKISSAYWNFCPNCGADMRKGETNE